MAPLDGASKQIYSCMGALGMTGKQLVEEQRIICDDVSKRLHEEKLAAKAVEDRLAAIEAEKKQLLGKRKASNTSQEAIKRELKVEMGKLNTVDYLDKNVIQLVESNLCKGNELTVASVVSQIKEEGTRERVRALFEKESIFSRIKAQGRFYCLLILSF